MTNLYTLAEDLTQLSKRYNEIVSPVKESSLYSQDRFCTQEEINAGKKQLARAGKLVIDFYDHVFQPGYLNQSNNPTIDKADKILENLSEKAIEYIGTGRYHELGELLTSNDSQNNNDGLDNLISRIENSRN